MKIDWSNVKAIDDKRGLNSRSRIIYKDGTIEPRIERYADLARLWSRARKALAEQGGADGVL